MISRYSDVRNILKNEVNEDSCRCALKGYYGRDRTLALLNLSFYDSSESKATKG